MKSLILTILVVVLAITANSFQLSDLFKIRFPKQQQSTACSNPAAGSKLEASCQAGDFIKNDPNIEAARKCGFCMGE